MANSTGRGVELTPPDSVPKLLAFYLPQFHPVPENDAWWQPGFTEWTNVVRAKPLFPGHYQPHLPGELGFYDLRLEEAREAQVRLAKEHGIYGFCYYHYWFHGQRMLGRPFDEVLGSGRPDFPFALCWANEDWTRNWDAYTGKTLIEQRYSEADDLEHIDWLCRAFSDDRYIKIDGRPLMLIYRVPKLPDPRRLADTWRQRAQRAGFPDLYLCRVDSHGETSDPAIDGFDASAGFTPIQAERVVIGLPGYRDHMVLDYESAVDAALAAPDRPYKRFPTVMVGWDNTARRESGARIYVNSTPEHYERWLSGTLSRAAHVRPEENFVFVVAWNEWAEGNHLEPDQRYGRAFLESTRRALGKCSPGDPAGDTREPDRYRYEYQYSPDSAPGHIVGLIEELVPKGRRVVDLGAGAGLLGEVLQRQGYRYTAVDKDVASLAVLEQRELDRVRCDLTDVEQVRSALDSHDDVAAILLVDVLEHLVEPQILLSALASWAQDHPSVVLLVSVPNVAHFDLGLGLLLGHWDPRPDGLLDSTHVRFFTNETLEHVTTSCGWRRVERRDYHRLRSEHSMDRTLADVPIPVVSALDLLARQENAYSTVYQFVWAFRADEPREPQSFLDAVAPDGIVDCQQADLAPQTAAWLHRYISELSLLEGDVRQLAINRTSREGESRDTGRTVAFTDGYEFPDRTVPEALQALEETFWRRPDLQAKYSDNGEIDLVGLLEWASEAAGTDDEAGALLEPYVGALAQVWVSETGRRTAQRLIDALGVDRLDLTPRERQALAELATLYDHRRDLRDAFDISHGDQALALIDWASHVTGGRRGGGTRIEAFREQFEAIRDAIPKERS